jgi:hypothetical protein
MQHGERIALDPGGERQAAGHDQRAAATPDGGAPARLPEPGQVELVTELPGLPDTAQGAIGPGTMR